MARFVTCMCIYYRELNKRTIKNSFLVPHIDPLLIESHGATKSTKVDLRFGYHQIRVWECDQSETTIRTHHGHYGFCVMPFGLINPLTTLQGTMNQIFKSYLRVFILVFFDDIFIYSQNLEHLQRLNSYGLTLYL